MNLTRALDSSLPELWRPQEIQGRSFWLEMPFYEPTRQIFRWTGIDQQPFIKDAVLRVSWTVMLEPESAKYRELLALPNPIVLRSGYHNFDDEMLSLPEEAYRRFEQDFGERFLGIHGIHERMGALEWGWSVDEVLAEITRKTGTPVERPRTREEAYELMRVMYQALTQKPYYKVYSTQAATVDHFMQELGAALCSTEIGGWEWCTPMQMAFSRGAGRQYGRPWGNILAAWGKGLVGDSHCAFNHLWPGGRVAFDTLGYMDEGPCSGTSYSLQKRQLYYSFMSGANLFVHESDCNYRTRVDSFEDEPVSVFVANYDELTIDEVDPLVRVLRDKPWYLSPVGKIFQSFHDNIASRRDRGVPYTPVALLFDRRHGLTLEYSETSVYNAGVPFGPGEYMARAVFNTLFPWEAVPPGTGGTLEGRTMVSGPFGDIFDALTGDSSPELLGAYPVIVLVGRITVDQELAAKLKAYVRGGGLLVANTRQLSESLGAEFFGCRLTGEELECREARSLLTGEIISEESRFALDGTELAGAEPLIVAADGAQPAPIATIMQCGQGKALLTLAPWLMPAGATNQMLQVFSHLMDQITRPLLPLQVEGDSQYLFNKSPQGWVVTLINNRGVDKAPAKAAVLDPAAASQVRIGFNEVRRREKIREVTEWLENQTLAIDRYEGSAWVSVTVPPGDIRIVEFVLAE